MTRKSFFAVVACGMFALAACSTDVAAPDELDALDSDVVDLLPDYALSPASVIDGAGVGAAHLPRELQLTAEQKAAIGALHEAFTAAHADEIAALREIERQLHELRQNGGTREQIRAKLAQAKAILDGLADDFAALQGAIWNVYTPEQRDWIEAHRPKLCDRGGAPQLTQDQVDRIRALRAAFVEAVAADMALIKQAHESAQAARRAGASRQEIEAILATAVPAMERVRAAERKLMEDILAVLTPEQRERWCVIRQQVAPPGPPRRP